MLVVTYVNYMEDQYPPSNCVVHDDSFDWGGTIPSIGEDIVKPPTPREIEIRIEG